MFLIHKVSNKSISGQQNKLTYFALNLYFPSAKLCLTFYSFFFCVSDVIHLKMTIKLMSKCICFYVFCLFLLPVWQRFFQIFH